MRSESLLALIFLLFALALVAYSFRYNMEARFGPLLIGLAVVPLLIVQLMGEIFSKSHSPKTKDPPIFDSVEAALPYLEFGFWACGLLILVYLAGVAAGLTLFLFVYLKRQKEGWVLSILFALGVFAFVYGVFGKLLGVYLYMGLIFE